MLPDPDNFWVWLQDSGLPLESKSSSQRTNDSIIVITVIIRRSQPNNSGSNGNIVAYLVLVERF